MSSSTPSATAGAGRPRDPQVDAAILAAARDLLGEVGYDRLSIEGLAERAGVAKTTIYRRWSTKAEVIAAALEDLRPPFDFPDTGSLASDLDAFLDQATDAADAAVPMQLQMMSALMASIARDDGMFDAYWDNYVSPRRVAFAKMFERAQQRGELRDDLDVERLVDLVAGALLYQMIRPSSQPLSDRVRQALALIWPGIVPTGQAPPN